MMRYDSIEQLNEKLVNQEVTVSELTSVFLDAIEQDDQTINSFLYVNKDKALEEAKALDELQSEGKVTNPLFGIPAGIKDNIVTKNIKTTCASKILEGFIPVYDATVMNKLNEVNAVNLGKLNLDEFAMGGSTETSYYKKTVNPFDHKAVPGGSSGGSAAAVAKSLVPYSLGSDTGGSVRQPAAYCGIVGMKPTYGRVSRFGLVAFASSLDQIGPMTRSVKDNAYVLNAISGYDKHDSTSANVEVPDFTQKIGQDIKNLKIAVPKEYLGEGVSDEVKANIQDALETFKSLGATVDEVSLPHSKYGLPAYYILASSEASSNLARFDGIHYGYQAEGVESLEELYKKTRSIGFGDEVKRRIMLGTYSLSAGHFDAYYTKAQKIRTLIKEDFDKVFNEYDIIVGPTAPTPAFDLGEQVEDNLTMYANDLLTIPVNLAGLPAISIPSGLSENDRPIGLQIIGKAFDESTIYQVAHAFETQFNLHDHYKKLNQ
ncbi:Asp-tRNA(Asn)/Glu-tRNA(Gln) amidotransferase subunit GatA [Abyssicoccus albus]|uniref:Asp-tRNA(Asn)/Glu-tRNA(Gln) amidotransferase subunit GatA n=1 Tax=Abyssicoccus albus TaxID=1817405 RepID=UPI00097E1EDF|nr:Asp-tRNA(Asn)/Glu-tRNA(Gln) amidotransferase subunit GatA [Abyssicoccus albus]AQL55808.1 aspartyl/glutamyl-tRNA amidotransferase subunit A [Abyssicoccus albus]